MCSGRSLAMRYTSAHYSIPCTRISQFEASDCSCAPSAGRQRSCERRERKGEKVTHSLNQHDRGGYNKFSSAIHAMRYTSAHYSIP